MPDNDLPTRLTQGLGRVIFAARWLMAPIYIGLLLALALLAVKFVQKLVALVPELMQMSGNDTVLAVLGLVDLSLVANLVLIVVLAGWQGFVAPLLDTHPDDQPAWLALDFSAIKLKLIGSMAVIAAIAIAGKLRARRYACAGDDGLATRHPAGDRRAGRAAGSHGPAEPRRFEGLDPCRSASSSSPISARRRNPRATTGRRRCGSSPCATVTATAMSAPWSTTSTPMAAIAPTPWCSWPPPRN